MKVLTQNGEVLTIPFTMQDTPPGNFERLNKPGATAKGIVSNMDDAKVTALTRDAAGRIDSIATPRQLKNDLRFIHRALIDVADGAEVGIEYARHKYRLLIPPEARAAREPLAVGDRCAMNANVQPKELLNTHGTVESIDGAKATVKIDEGDRQRLNRATGKSYPATFKVTLTRLDKTNT